MSYLHPDYEDWYHLKGGPAVVPERARWRAYNPVWDHEYEATEYADGWFTVDGDEWFGEFPSRADAEAYLSLAFQIDTRYDEEP